MCYLCPRDVQCFIVQQPLGVLLLRALVSRDTRNQPITTAVRVSILTSALVLILEPDIFGPSSTTFLEANRKLNTRGLILTSLQLTVHEYSLITGVLN